MRLLKIQPICGAIRGTQEHRSIYGGQGVTATLGEDKGRVYPWIFSKS